jgi:hypothetical protein
MAYLVWLRRAGCNSGPRPASRWPEPPNYGGTTARPMQHAAQLLGLQEACETCILGEFLAGVLVSYKACCKGFSCSSSTRVACHSVMQLAGCERDVHLSWALVGHLQRPERMIKLCPQALLQGNEARVIGHSSHPSRACSVAAPSLQACSCPKLVMQQSQAG